MATAKISQEKSSMSRLARWLEPHPALDGMAVMDHLFNRLDGLYPQRWRAAFPSPEAIANWREAWADGFADEGIVLREIQGGLRACRQRFAWPPSFAEFLSACRPPVDFEAAFREACEQLRRREAGEDVWSRPAIYWAAATIGEFDLRNATWPSIKTRWTAVLQAELDRREWPDIPPPRVALPAPGQCSVPPDVAMQRIAKLRDQLAAKMAMQ